MAVDSRCFYDNIHPMIVFSKKNPFEKMLLDVIDTKEFQRLKFIKQLGLVGAVYPSAEHTRFAHSLGVYKNAGHLIGIVREKTGEKNIKAEQEIKAAALLHDIGHGPFSHVFETVMKEVLKNEKSHEEWGHDVIAGGTKITEILNRYDRDFAKRVAKRLIKKADEKDIYDEILSSAVDADRMDYLKRDQLNVGLESFGFDITQLFRSLDVNGEKDRRIFALKAKAVPSIEDYIKGRLNMYQKVYLYKGVKAVEYDLVNAMKVLRDPLIVKQLSAASPVRKFIESPSIGTYQLIDADVLSCLKELRHLLPATHPAQASIGAVFERNILKCFDFTDDLSIKKTSSEQKERKINAVKAYAKEKSLIVEDYVKKAYDPDKAKDRIWIVSKADGKVRDFSEYSDIARNEFRTVRVFSRNLKQIDQAVKIWNKTR